MRLWHQSMIHHLSDQHILGQHRECCALRGNGWGKKHSVVDYVFEYSPFRLFLYHLCIMKVMFNRGFTADARWSQPLYRGTSCEKWSKYAFTIEPEFLPFNCRNTKIYKEHDHNYLVECANNLREKGFEINYLIEGLKSEGEISAMFE